MLGGYGEGGPPLFIFHMTILPSTSRASGAAIRRRFCVWRGFFALQAARKGAIVSLLVAAGCVLALGQGLKHVIDAGFGQASPAILDAALAGVLALAVLLSVATFARFYLMMSTGERVITDIRRAVFGHLLDLSPGFFEVTRTGEVISRLTNDTSLLEVVIGSSASFALRNTLIMAGSLVMLFVTSPKLTALVLLGVPLVIAPILLYGRRVRTLSRASQARVADVSVYIDEALHEIRTVQSYGHEMEDRARFGERVEQAFATAAERIRQRALLIALVMLLAFGAVGVILWIGGGTCRREPQRRRAFGIHFLLRGLSGRHRGDLRGRRGPATRGRCDRTPVRVARYAPDHRSPRAARGGGCAHAWCA